MENFERYNSNSCIWFKHVKLLIVKWSKEQYFVTKHAATKQIKFAAGIQHTNDTVHKYVFCLDAT